MLLNIILEYIMSKLLSVQIENLKLIDKQRKAWLVLSAFVIAVITFLIFDHEKVKVYGILWQIGVLGLTVSVVWWYWAMRMIRHLIKSRMEEILVLVELYESVKQVKEEVENLPLDEHFH